MEMIPDLVVIRNDHSPYMFTVDGVRFPWYVSERGPLITRVANDLYIVDVEVFLMGNEDQKLVEFALKSSDPDVWAVPYVPLLGGVEFPWLITDDEMVLRFSHKQLPALSVRFYAHDVDTNLDVTDERRDGDVYCAGGWLIASG